MPRLERRFIVAVLAAVVVFAGVACGSQSGTPLDGGLDNNGNGDLTGADGMRHDDMAEPDGDGSAGDAAPGGCGPGTTFCNSACGICVLVGGACQIDTCGNGDAGEPCGGPRCGPGTHCAGQTCLPV
jgi:hypothetical protein